MWHGSVATGWVVILESQTRRVLMDLNVVSGP